MARPNILFLMADQQKATSLPHYGNTVVRAPTLERLAARGITAENFYVQNPLCAPSRAVFHTGRYPQALRMFANANHLPPDEVLLAEVLRDAGYRTGAVGHVHGRGGLTRGFEWVDDFDQGRLRERWRGRAEIVKAAAKVTQHMTARLPFEPEEDVDGLMTSSALSFIDAAAEDRSRPFFLHVAWISPHPPYFAPSPYAEMYDPASVRLPPAETERQHARKPRSYLETARDSGTLEAPEAERRESLAYYYGMGSYLDDLSAQLLDRLQRRGLLENTVIVYTSDHGDYAGEHHMFGKSTSLYDCLVRVPLILSGPAELVPQGSQLEGMAEAADVFPTLLDLAGGAAPRGVNVHGHSLRPHWEGRAEADGAALESAFALSGGWRRDRIGTGVANLPFGCPASGRQNDLLAMVRTGDWKYVHGARREVQELYNVAADPYELENLWGLPEHAGMVTELRTRILDWQLGQT